MRKRQGNDYDLPKLPEWLDEVLPDLNPHMTLTVSEDKERMVLTYLDGTTAEFSDLPSLDEALKASGAEVEIDDEVYEVFGDRRTLFYPIEGGKYYAMISSITDEVRYALMQEAFSYSVDYIEDYRKERSFRFAWRMIDSHPAFWIAPNIVKSPWLWQTSGHCSRLRQWLDITDEAPNGAYIWLETGGHCELSDSEQQPPYSQHYGDWRLEVSGNTFEEAIINLAERVLLVFNDDGTYKSEDEISLPEPEWVKEVKRRVDEKG